MYNSVFIDEGADMEWTMTLPLMGSQILSSKETMVPLPHPDAPKKATGSQVESTWMNLSFCHD
jgi:hypothetical protein